MPEFFRRHNIVYHKKRSASAHFSEKQKDEENYQSEVVSEMPIRLKQQKISKAQTPPLEAFFQKHINKLAFLPMQCKSNAI